MATPDTAIRAQAHLHHALLLGLELMVATREGPTVMGDWMFRLFRRQHEEKFLSSFAKLGLDGLPHAVACARYHVLSNGIGGVGVEFMAESDTKAWVRFRYPRWMFHGPTLCGVPVEASRGFLRGWYAHNGVSLGNARLGFVCVSEDMTGEYGLCGYFREFDYPLTEEERLQFAPHESPPPFDAAVQPLPPQDQWDDDRLLKASRNYALDYIRNGVITLAAVIGETRTKELAGLAAKLIGLQYFSETAAMIDAEDGRLDAAARYLERMFGGLGDEVSVERVSDAVTIRQNGLRIARGLPPQEQTLLLDCWIPLWAGVMQSMRQRKQLICRRDGNTLVWTLTVAS